MTTDPITTRPLLPQEQLSAEAVRAMAGFHADAVQEVITNVARHDVVVVGMAQNPHVRNVRQALADAGIPFEYLEFGSYLKGWYRRLAIKLWSGWPTFPQVFVRGQFIGGAALTRAAIADGSLRARLAEPRTDASPGSPPPPDMA